MRMSVAMETVACLPLSSTAERVQTDDALREAVPSEHPPNLMPHCPRSSLSWHFSLFPFFFFFFMNESTQTHNESSSMLTVWKRIFHSVSKQLQLRDECFSFFLPIQNVLAECQHYEPSSKFVHGDSSSSSWHHSSAPAYVQVMLGGQHYFWHLQEQGVVAVGSGKGPRWRGCVRDLSITTTLC